MRKRRLLLITYHFPPSGAVAVFRLLSFARYLPRHDWEVSVIAPPHMPGEPLDPALSKEVPAQTRVHPVPFPVGKTWSLAWRVFGENLWLPLAMAKCVEVIRRERPDCVVTSSPPHNVHYLGLLLKRLHGLPWLADFRDPWITNSRAAGSRKLGDRAQAWLERQVMIHADRIIANTPLTRAGLLAAFPQHASKIGMVPNGFDPERFPAPASANGGSPKRLTLLHAGELYSGRDPRPLLDALANYARHRSPQTPSWRLLLLGQSTENRFDLKDAIRQRGLDHAVEFGGQVPYAEALAAMTQADILLVLDTPGRRLSIPAKLYEYLGAGRPILALAEPDGDVAWALRVSGATHRVVPALNVARIEKALTELRGELHQPAPSSNAADQRLVFSRARLAGIMAENVNLCVNPSLRALAKVELSPVPVPRPVVGNDSDVVPAAPPASRPHYVGA